MNMKYLGSKSIHPSNSISNIALGSGYNHPSLGIAKLSDAHRQVTEQPSCTPKDILFKFTTLIPGLR